MGPDDRATGLDRATVAVGGGAVVLHDVSLLAAPGEMLAVVGPSGSGKTMVLRTVAGLERVRSGRVLVVGRDVTRVAPPDRNVAMVFQAATLLPFLDVAENLTRAAMARGERGPAPQRRLDDRGRRLGLGGLLPRMPRTLSAGERALTGIGRALVQAPVAFLFDEPLAHLDSVERARARRTIMDVVKQAGVPALYATHDQAEAMAVADRIAVLREGAVVQVDTPRGLYDRPVDVFVAGFVGEPEIGLLPARPVAAGYRVGARTLPLWGARPAGTGEGPVLLGLRAEDVEPAGTGADPSSVALPVVVRHVVEYPAAHPVLVAEVALPGEADGARLVARVERDTRLRPGDRIDLAVDAGRAHVFDPGTGRALSHPG